MKKLFLFVAVASVILAGCAGSKVPPKSFCKDFKNIINIAETDGAGELRDMSDEESDSFGKSWGSNKQLAGMEGTIYESFFEEGDHYASYNVIKKADASEVEDLFDDYRDAIIECLGSGYYENVGDDDNGRVRWFYVNGEDILNTTHAYISLSESMWGDGDNELYIYIYDPAQ